MPIPSLPIETTTEIILLAVQDLVEQERNCPTPLSASLVNAFLLSTSLVSPTWRSISQLALLMNGLVGPSGAEGFLRQIGDRGMVASTRSVRVWSGVRWGPGGTRRDLDLVSTLRGIERIEIVGSAYIPRALERRVSLSYLMTPFQAEQLAGTHFTGLEHLLLTNQNFVGARNTLLTFSSCPPSRLTIVETTTCLSHAMIPPFGQILTPIFQHLHHFEITSSTPKLAAFIPFLAGAPTLQATPFPLQTCRLESSDPASLARLPRRTWSDSSRLNLLRRLATHLRILDFSPSDGATLPPHLTSVEVLPNPAPERYRRLDSALDVEAEAILLAVVNGLAKLESLVVPRCWRSFAVTELCESRWVALVWTA